jgi:hypothetical protein
MDTEEISPGCILKHRRSRPWSPQAVERDKAATRQIRKAAKARFNKACDAGVWKRISNIVLEPKNPFDAKAPRRPRQEAIVLGALILTSVLLAVYLSVASGGVR